MSPAQPPILVVDDEKNMRRSLQTLLEDEGFAAHCAGSAEEALELLAQGTFMMVITDARLGGMTGYEFLGRLRTNYPGLPSLMITAYATPKLAVEAIQAGAMDYLAKPFAPEELLHCVRRAAERHQLLEENAALRRRSGELPGLEQIVGEAPELHELRQLIRTVSPTDARVLILGESGTGKELVASALHALSRRRERPCIRLNCAAIPEPLLESELFGHEKGAFTGALKQKSGRVEEANGGTIFLDEIGDMGRSLQAKLLRFLEDGTFTRVGGSEELRVNVRILAATNRNIQHAIAAGDFREDLYHRLNVVQILLPPLRARSNDVLVLAEHFLKSFRATMEKPLEGFTPEARRHLLAHHWPGNVRELRNVIERAAILETGPLITPASLPVFTAPPRPQASGVGLFSEESLDDGLRRLEEQIIQGALEQNHFNLSRAATQLKLTRHSLRYRMQRLNFKLPGDAADHPGN